jgi:hypothetical protein
MNSQDSPQGVRRRERATPAGSMRHRWAKAAEGAGSGPRRSPPAAESPEWAARLWAAEGAATQAASAALETEIASTRANAAKAEHACRATDRCRLANTVGRRVPSPGMVARSFRVPPRALATLPPTVPARRFATRERRVTKAAQREIRGAARGTSARHRGATSPSCRFLAPSAAVLSENGVSEPTGRHPIATARTASGFAGPPAPPRSVSEAVRQFELVTELFITIPSG